MLNNKKFYVGGILIFIGIAYLGYVGFTGSVTYYYTVSELADVQESINGDNYRVSGTVVRDSVQEEISTRTLKFVITDGEEHLPVVYQGVIPDSFTSEGEVMIEGRLDSDGIFQASSILTKCPSRYAPEN